jgi:NAD-dependent SIR2 family protein deacetylase
MYARSMNPLSKEQFKKKYGILAKFRCQKCKRQWEQQPGFIGDEHEACPKCKHLWVDWLNSEEVLKRINKKRFDTG